MIPKEIDELMWKIAEDTDASAVEEFGNRYPKLRDEMLKRIRTIKALKSGKRLPPSTSVPVFQNAQVQPTNWKKVGIPFAVALFAVAAFGIWKSIPKVEPAPKVNSVNSEPSLLPQDQVQFAPELQVPKQPGPRVGIPAPTPIQPKLDPGTLPIPEKLTSVQIESAPLKTAIEMIAADEHLTVTFAPGMPNPEIKVNYTNMSRMDMLKDLGKQYAFTTVLDGERAILIIPKRDEDEGQITGNG